MELREIWNLFCKEKNVFLLIVGIFLIGAVLWVNFEPKRFESNTLITIGRTEGKSMPVATDYQYDNFYRLQADERFGDTLVKLLATPQVTRDIFAEAGISGNIPKDNYFVGRKLSSQIVEVTFVDKDQAKLKALAGSVPTILNRYTSELNTKDVNQNNWFQVIASEPVVSDARVSPKQVWAIALFLGLFFGFWIVLIKHYLQIDPVKK